MRTVSVGVCAYNEESNIGHAIESVLSQELSDPSLLEVLVVSSGSTDRTDAIVKEAMEKDPRVLLLRQERREGKNSAVNLFLSQAKGDLLVLVNADNTLELCSLSRLVAPFQDPKVGMVGGHPVPVNSKDSLSGFAVNMLWDLHHRLSLQYPKAGELVAFRNVHLSLPTDMQSDEDILRMELEKRGYRTEYAPGAIVHNKGPVTLGDFWKQRVRVNIGEQYMKRKFRYRVPTWNLRFLFPALVDLLKENRRHLGKMAAFVVLELATRAYASIYVALDKGDKTVWSMVSSTKKLE